MKGRTVGLTVVMIAAIAIVIWWTRRERANEQAALDEANAAAANPAAAGSGSSTTTTSAGSGSTDKVRKIDPASRTALLDRIASARAARTTGTAATSAGPRPALPALTGTISKDDIRAGVRAVIPLLAECYDAALDRLSTKAGKIVVEMHLTGEPDVGTLIEKAEVGGDEHFTRDAELVECFQQTMLSLELPPIEGGGTVDVTYPIAFAPN